MSDDVNNADLENSDESPGWDAISAALSPLYGDQEPKHYGAVLPYVLGGNDPLQGISVYASEIELPHWHYVTYGFSELYAKETEDPSVSGYGFELTFRLPREPISVVEPPMWPLNFLQNIARYVFKTGNCFAAHHHVDLNGPIALNEPTDITAICFEADPQLGFIDTPNGAVDFLQVVGLCGDEYQLAKRSSSEVLLRFLAEDSPLLITKLDRASLLADPQRSAVVRAAAAEAGSSQGEVFAVLAETLVEGNRLRVRLAANAVSDLLSMVELRIGADRPFMIHGTGMSIAFRPRSSAGWETSPEGMSILFVSPALREEVLSKIAVRRGVYRFESCPELELEIVPTDIKDAAGNVTKTIG